MKKLPTAMLLLVLLFNLMFQLPSIGSIGEGEDVILPPPQSSNDDHLSIAIVLQTILFAVVFLVGLVGNTLVIYVVSRFSKMQTVTNMYIVNLAVADECFLVGIPFLIVTMAYRRWIFGYYMCKTYMITTSINQFTSSILLCIMSADRYIAVCHPISAPRWRTIAISKIVIILAWTFSILLIIPIIKHATETEQDTGEKSCVIDWSSSDTNTAIGDDYYATPTTKNLTSTISASPDTMNTIVNSNVFDGNITGVPMMDMSTSSATIFTTYTFVFSFAIPLSLILVFYCLVIQKLKTVGPKHKSKEKKRSHRKVTQLVLTVITVYVICWLPYWITQIAMLTSTTLPTSTFIIALHLMASCLSYSNSAMNPILYAFLSDNFKKSFMKACTCTTGRDINAALHVENSAFPRRTAGRGHLVNSVRRQRRGESGAAARHNPDLLQEDEDEDDDDEEEYMAVNSVMINNSKEHSTTLTSRTNMDGTSTSLDDSREMITKSAQNGGSTSVSATMAVLLSQHTTL